MIEYCGKYNIPVDPTRDYLGSTFGVLINWFVMPFANGFKIIAHSSGMFYEATLTSYEFETVILPLKTLIDIRQKLGTNLLNIQLTFASGYSTEFSLDVEEKFESWAKTLNDLKKRM